MKRPYQIIILSNGKQIEYIKSYTTEKQVFQAFFNLQNKNKDSVMFPVKYINIGRHIVESNYEIAIIKHKDIGDNNLTLIRNNFGMYIPYETNHKDWIICDKAPYYKEESFWVYGYHPLVQRKSLSFILNEFIKPFQFDKDVFLNFFIFKNKLLIERGDTLDLIICKNKSDAIRLYNTIQDFCTSNKFKYVLFSGDSNTTKYMREQTIDKIHQLTNWNELKINRSTTRP